MYYFYLKRKGYWSRLDFIRMSSSSKIKINKTKNDSSLKKKKDLT